MNSLKQLYKDIKTSWGKKFRWITAFFLLWIYRTIFMPAGDGGFAQALQIISLFSMLFIVYSHWQRKVVGIFRISNPPIRTLLLLYFYALLSATWAFMPAFSAFLSIQNFILMALTFWLLSMPKTFDGVEKSLVYLIMAMAFFSAIGGRYNVGWPIFIHLLQTGTCSAMCFAYCFAEWIKEKKDKKRLRFFRTVMLISFVLLVTSTSSGANASCVAGIGTAMLFSGHAMWGALMACIGIFAFIYQDQLMDLLLLIMPGKTKATIESATGRDRFGCTSFLVPGLRPSPCHAGNGPPTGWAGWGREWVPFGKRQRVTVRFSTFSCRQRTTSPARPSRWAGHEALVLEAAGQANT